MVPPQLRNRLNASVAALLLSALVLSACKQAASATATPTKVAPAATATQGQAVAPADTNTPPPTADNSILFQDDFSDRASGWPTIQADSSIAGYQDPGQYRLDLSAPLVVLLAARPGAFSDFSLETIVSASAASGQFRYGVAFRQLTPDNYYAAFVNPVNQTFLVAKRLLGEFTTLASGQNAAIPTNGDPVTLRIDAQGPNLTFSINGTGLVTLVDGSFAAGDVGYVLETHEDAATARLDADNIVIRRFNADTVPAAPPAGAVAPTATGTPDANASNTPVPPTVRPIGSVQPPATQALPATEALQATAGAIGTTFAATANAAATQACALLGCP